MARHSSGSPAKPSRDSKSKDRKEPVKEHAPPSAAIRETIESIVIAFALAFLFRTFDAEAFVIPTGSMATTLMGRHRDVACEKCGYRYQVNASEEVSPEGAQLFLDAQKQVPVRVNSCTCPMCRYTMNIGPDNPQDKDYPAYTGDRILVGKFIYDVSDPKRWDVAVFKFPGDAQTNYIKRLVGLPHEQIRINRGDIFVTSEGKDENIARKPPRKMLAMLRPVFDNDYMPQIAKFGWPARWQPEGSGFKPLDDQKSFESDPAAGMSSIRYWHRTPTWQDWQIAARGSAGNRNAPYEVAPQLITDFLGYNTDRLGSAQTEPEIKHLGLFWVGDLALESEIELRGSAGTLVFELVKGGRLFQCRVNIADGTAQMAIVGNDARDFHPAGKTPLKGPGKHTVVFSNIDRQLRLFVDGALVRFGDGDAATCYDDLHNFVPTEADLSPAAIGADGAAVRVSGLKVMRDLFYITPDNMLLATDCPPGVLPAEFFSSPQDWPMAFQDAKSLVFNLKADQFLALGDNSARSKDGRYWGDEGVESYVARDLLTGKAFFIYWPHSWNSPVPFFPNFSRMGFVR